ncbi:MAG: mechanosensitive ion channel family protein [Methanobacterium sp.]
MAIEPILIDIIIVAVILIAAYVIINVINYFIKKTSEQFDLEITVTQVLQEIILYSIIIIAVIIILDFFGINITGLVLSLGILGIVVGFAARDTLSNFISGLFVLGTKSFKVGDFIEVSGQMGTVTKMGFRITNMVTIDNKAITIPNSIFSTDPLINYTALNKRRVELEITIPYELDLEDVIKSLEQKASMLNWALSETKPKVIVKELSDVGLNVTLNVWTNDPWNVTIYRSELAIEISKLLMHKKN